MSDALKRLREPFEDTDINKLPKPVKKAQQGDPRFNCRKGHADFAKASADGVECGGYHTKSVHLDYVGHAALTARLLDADPEWDWEPVAFGEDGLPVFDRNGGLWIRLTVGGVTRLGYGDAQGKTGPNAIKEAIGDALRNAGMRFGAALDLWHKGDLSDAEDARNGAQQESRPAVDDAAVREWIETLEAADSIPKLQASWEAAGKAGVTGDRRVIAATNKRKAALSG